MIIGHGDIASVLKDKKGFLFFASGVSNSQETRESEYQREIDLLLMQPRGKRLVYISSLCVFYSNGRYARHKRSMESLIKDTFKQYALLRIGNITWGNNPHTIINYLRKRKEKGKELEIRDVYRYVIDKEELLHWIDLIPDWNCEMNITGRRMKVKQIVEKYVR